jgi:hypothetical protein
VVGGLLRAECLSMSMLDSGCKAVGFLIFVKSE